MGKAGLREQGRQLHAAVLETARRVEKPCLEKGLHRWLHFRNQNRLAVLIARLVFIALAVMRGEVLFGNGARGAQRGVEGFAIVLRKARALGEGLGTQHFVEFEGQVAGAEQGLGHGGIPCWECIESRREYKASQSKLIVVMVGEGRVFIGGFLKEKKIRKSCECI
ncbi:hypothetical protein D9M71_232650 [compost metagenome]